MLWGLSSRFPPSGCRTLRLPDGGCVKECLKVLTELLFLWSCWLRVSSEEYGHNGEILGGPFRNGGPVNVVDDAVAYFLRVFTPRHSCGFQNKLVVESRLLLIEHSLLTVLTTKI
jgi:hypothetical protein